MREVRQPEQQLAQLALVVVVVCGQPPFVVAERTAARLQRLRLIAVAGAAERADHLGQLVHLSPQCVAACGRLAQALVECHDSVELLEQLRPSSQCERGPHRVGREAELANVDHRPVTLPVDPPRARAVSVLRGPLSRSGP
jgi:hypothetical protein